MPERETKLSAISARIAKTLAAEMRRLRGDRTAAAAAKLLGIARPNYSRSESGSHEPSLSTLVRNVQALGGDPREVLGRILDELEDRPAPPAPAPSTRATPGARVEVDYPRGFALPERRRT